MSRNLTLDIPKDDNTTIWETVYDHDPNDRRLSVFYTSAYVFIDITYRY